jgi:two-component system, sensor histidine kinase YesM
MIARMINRLKRLHLTTKLILSYLLFLAIPLVVLTGSIYLVSSRQLENQAISGADQTFAVLKRELNTVITNSGQIHTRLMENQSILAFLRKDDSSAMIYSDGWENYKALANWIDSIQSTQTGAKLRIYMLEHYDYICNNINTFNIASIRDTQWFASLRKSNSNNDWFVSRGENGSEVFMASIIYDPYQLNRVIGVFRVDISSEILKDYLNRALAAPGDEVALLDRDGSLIVSAGTASPFATDTKASRQYSKDYPQWYLAKQGQNAYIMRCETLNNKNWEVASVIPLNSLLESTIHLKNIILLVWILLTAPGVFGAWAASDNLTRRIRLLVKHMRQISQTGFLQYEGKKGYDEIGVLIDNYNDMSREINTLTQAHFESGKALKTAELRLLQAQINPHLLYNSLDNIYILGIKNKMPEIASMAKALISFYKQGLSKGREMVPVSSEILHIQAYLQIQNLRFQDVLRLDIDVDECHMNYLIPRLTLQPIVENSVLHGIFEKDTQCGVISICSTVSDGVLLLRIGDDGVGMSRHQTDRLNLPPQFGADHFGITNVNERLKLTFGSQYGLEFESAPGCGTTVTVRVPTIEPEADGDDLMTESGDF